MNAIEKIEENYRLLTKAEKKLANYVVSNQDKVIHSTMSELNQRLNVGDATIIRLCKKLGFNGFTDLKISIAKNNIHSTDETFENFSLMDKINESLQRTHQLINENNFNNAIKMIKEAQNIFIFGKGQSGMAAIDLEKLLLSIGIQAKASVDSDFQVNSAATMKKGDLLIIFSLTGRTSDLIDPINIAKERAAKVLSITNYLLSPIAKLSDIVLQSSYDEFISSSVPGRISQMYISGLLTNLYEQKYQSEDILNIKETTLRKIITKRIDE